MFTEHHVTEMKQEALIRECRNLRVYVVGGGFQYLKMFFDAGLSGARFVEDSDIVCFTGGEDVDPALYGENAIPGTHFNTSRDNKESDVYAQAVMYNKPMVGICRGAQFLNVMNGGKLWQDINKHAGQNHSLIHVPTGEEVFDMTSTHHQQMRPGKDAQIIAVAKLSTTKKCADEEVHRLEPELDDMEVLWYPDSLSLCFQPHPEYFVGECRRYFLELFDNYILPAT